MTETSIKFHWFGDSWVAGDELENPAQHRFSELVSQHFGATCLNYGINGSGVTALPVLLHSKLSQIGPNDTVFFCLTSSIRTSMFDEHNKLKNILVNGYAAHDLHPHSDQWFRYFDNAAQRVYNYDSTINLLWLWCKHLDLKCYFLNLFTTEPTSIIDCVPESAWLVPRDKCIAQSILSTIDNKYGSIFVDDNPELTNQQWKIQKQQVEQYIRPNFAHPNIQGHAKIANDLIELINERSRI